MEKKQAKKIVSTLETKIFGTIISEGVDSSWTLPEISKKARTYVEDLDSNVASDFEKELLKDYTLDYSRSLYRSLYEPEMIDLDMKSIVSSRKAERSAEISTAIIGGLGGYLISYLTNNDFFTNIFATGVGAIVGYMVEKMYSPFMSHVLGYEKSRILGTSAYDKSIRKELLENLELPTLELQ